MSTGKVSCIMNQERFAIFLLQLAESDCWLATASNPTFTKSGDKIPAHDFFALDIVFRTHLTPAPAMDLVSLVTGRPGGHSVILDSDCCGSSLRKSLAPISATCQGIDLVPRRNHWGKVRENGQPDRQRRQVTAFQDYRQQLKFNSFEGRVRPDSLCDCRTLQGASVALYNRWRPSVETSPPSSLHCLRNKECGGYLTRFTCREWRSHVSVMSFSLATIRTSYTFTVRRQAHAFQWVTSTCKRRRDWMQQAVEDNQAIVEGQDLEKYQRATESVNGENNTAQAQKLVQSMVETTDNRVEVKDEPLPPEGFIVFMSCVIGLLTGVCVVLFNRGEHWLHDLLWHGVSGPSWLRAHSVDQPWQQVIFIPTAGGMVVGLLNALRSKLDAPSQQKNKSFSNGVKAFCKPVLKAASAVITLGTGNSLGPEGPSVEIGASVASGIGSLLQSSKERNLSFIAAGSAAGISSGFNAAVAGCFFAVESVLRPVSGDNTSSSLTTALIILSSVLASVVSQAGLGSEPAFKIPLYDFRSPAELPLYLLLGILCGAISVALTRGAMYATSAFDFLKARGVPAPLLPSLGGLCVGMIALAYPEILYWGFENVEFLLQSRMPWVRNPPADLLIQLVGVKVVATSLCRGSGLVGGVYAPSLFIGAALGSAYGSMVTYAIASSDPMYHLDILQVAAPQAYALVGMAATLAGVCQVPLTSVLLLFELTQDYRIILPLMGAVGLSSWIASSATRKRDPTVVRTGALKQSNADATGPTFADTAPKTSLPTSAVDYETVEKGGSYGQDICTIESSLCLTTLEVKEEDLKDMILVAAAMRTAFAVVSPGDSVRRALEVMIEGKEWCVLVVNNAGLLEGILTLGDVQQEAEQAFSNGVQIKADRRPVSEVCKTWSSGKIITVHPDMSLRAAERRMIRRGIRQLPVVARCETQETGRLVLGLLDKDSIARACRAEATRRMLIITQLNQQSAQR